MDHQMPDMAAYAAEIQRVMAAALTRAEMLQAEAVADRDAAHADRDKMNDLVRECENRARRAVEDEILPLREQVQEALYANLKAKLNNSGKSPEEVDRLLQIITNS